MPPEIATDLASHQSALAASISLPSKPNLPFSCQRAPRDYSVFRTAIAGLTQPRLPITPSLPRAPIPDRPSAAHRLVRQPRCTPPCGVPKPRASPARYNCCPPHSCRPFRCTRCISTLAAKLWSTSGVLSRGRAWRPSARGCRAGLCLRHAKHVCISRWRSAGLRQSATCLSGGGQ